MSNPRLCVASRRAAGGPLGAASLAFALAFASPALASRAVAAHGTEPGNLGPAPEGGVNSVAGIEIEGVVDAEYALATVQAVETAFGDNANELDAAYILERGGRLFLVLTGNLEYNFNRLEIFFDTKGGGENVLTATPDYDEDLGAGSWASNNLGGLKFDAAFTADYHLVASWGNPEGLRVLFVNRSGGGSATVPGAAATGAPRANNVSVGVINAGATAPNASSSSLTDRLFFAIDNNCVAGVLGGSAAADQTAAAAVATGMRLSIPLADLGWPAKASTIRISAMIDNGDHNYLSNQTLGALPPPEGNLGGDGAGNFTGTLSGVDFTQFAGSQHFTFVILGTIFADGFESNLLPWIHVP